jgi:hypothetical protein
LRRVKDRSENVEITEVVIDGNENTVAEAGTLTPRLAERRCKSENVEITEADIEGGYIYT